MKVLVNMTTCVKDMNTHQRSTSSYCTGCSSGCSSGSTSGSSGGSSASTNCNIASDIRRFMP